MDSKSTNEINLVSLFDIRKQCVMMRFSVRRSVSLILYLFLFRSPYQRYFNTRELIHLPVMINITWANIYFKQRCEVSSLHYKSFRIF